MAQPGETMKRWIGLLALLGLVAFVGCGGDEGTPSPTGPTGQTHDGTINATIDGDLVLNFRCTTAYGLQGTGGQGTTGSMHVQGIVSQGADSYMIDIQVFHDPAVGTYQLAFPAEDGIATVAKNNVGNFSESGSVTVTQTSATRLAGTFSFTAFRMTGVGQKVTVTVTEGTFDVPVILNGS
jgi:hypothetical protein